MLIFHIFLHHQAATFTGDCMTVTQMVTFNSVNTYSATSYSMHKMYHGKHNMHAQVCIGT